MLSVQQAIQQLLASVQPGATETLPLAELPGRILAKEILSPLALPRFDNSAMDGWAVRSADVAAASPTKLHRIATVPAGASFAGEIRAGQCVRIFTGSPLPAGADAVVMQEDAREEQGSVLILEGVKPWENIRFQGEDIKAGAAIGQTGETVAAGVVALLGACGITEAAVFKKPRVAILATGSELREPGRELAPGEIYESNRLMIATLVRQTGAVAEIKEIVADNLDNTVAAIRLAAAAEVVITCGGVSVGEFDFVKEAIQKLGGSLDFWRVAVRPGKPFLRAKVLGKPLFGLPGNPVSALVTFEVFVRPALLRIGGATDTASVKLWGELAEDISNPGDRTHFTRVAIDPEGLVRVSGAQASHRLASLAAANGLLEIPPGATWEKGRRVGVARLY